MKMLKIGPRFAAIFQKKNSAEQIDQLWILPSLLYLQGNAYTK